MTGLMEADSEHPVAIAVRSFSQDSSKFALLLLLSRFTSISGNQFNDLLFSN